MANGKNCEKKNHVNIQTVGLSFMCLHAIKTKQNHPSSIISGLLQNLSDRLLNTPVDSAYTTLLGGLPLPLSKKKL